MILAETAKITKCLRHLAKTTPSASFGLKTGASLRQFLVENWTHSVQFSIKNWAMPSF